MTNGDYVFFMYSSLYSSTPVEQPWLEYDIDEQERERRLKAFYAVKQVAPLTLSFLFL